MYLTIAVVLLFSHAAVFGLGMFYKGAVIAEAEKLKASAIAEKESLKTKADNTLHKL